MLKRTTSVSLAGGLTGALLLAFTGLPATAGELEVRIEGIEAVTGQIHLGLYASSSAEAFPDKLAVTHGAKVDVRGKTVTYTFYGLVEDYYAVATYHDANGNGKFDTNLLGVPRERFGFSRNPSIGLRAPSFDETRVPVPANGRLRITIRLQNAF